jgi:glycosyltransferase involved in cell wall biosynthesis
MDWASQCAVVIPCLNEAATIRPLVQEIRRLLPAVWVMDDGSADATPTLAQEAGATVIRFDSSRGKGAALREGWSRARDKGFAWVISMDGDGQHAPRDISRFLERAGTERVDLIIGNRMPQASEMPWVRRQVNQWMSRRLSRLANIDAPDTQCGFRMMRLEAWSKIHLNTEHYEIESEVLLAFAREKFRIAFVPIEVVYRQERSKIRPLRDTIRWFRWLRSWKR